MLKGGRGERGRGGGRFGKMDEEKEEEFWETGVLVLGGRREGEGRRGGDVGPSIRLQRVRRRLRNLRRQRGAPCQPPLRPRPLSSYAHGRPSHWCSVYTVAPPLFFTIQIRHVVIIVHRLVDDSIRPDHTSRCPHGSKINPFGSTGCVPER